MTHFLIRYNRRTEDGQIVARFSEQEFSEANTALRDAEAGKSPQEEIVLLTSDSEDTLKKTHARYFVSADDLTHV